MDSTTSATSTTTEPLRMAVTFGQQRFDLFVNQRQWMLEPLAGAFRVFGREGYAEGIAGHISVRDPKFSDRFWINPLAVHISMMKVRYLICLDMQRNVVAGNKSVPANAAGVLIHTACHLARPDAHAICHAHSLYGKAWAAFGRPLDMISQDVCYFHNAHSVYDNFGGIAFAADECTNIAHALGPNKAAILVNHGLITVGQTVDEAAYLYTLLEKSCKIQLMVESTGLPKRVVPEEEAANTFRMASTPDTLFVEFQPSYKLEEYLDPSFKE
ncbi:hypothetical protein CERZMDRAFT_103575 [Cercospora zeae-maydis SCOH1-5]|uniref:Class II aldolase/adducin N-terminal domain-containing protein n=1 Tax=Cercospora zeae-maydis SCOH1-5 TaxID=717836 RepID=A0A6A6F157_9PEZI|nr:hypothetical protein CERZMDRAFT_103575 [Cercospora zeae-maydis SCOH1-5]